MNKKKIFSDYLFNLARVMLNIALPIIILPYVISQIGNEGYGKFAYANSIIAFFTLIAGLGIKDHASRTIASIHNEKLRNKAASEIWIIQLISTTIALSVFVLFYLFFAGDEYKTLYVVFSILIIGGYLNTEWYYIGTLKFKYISIRTMIIKLLNVVAIFLAINDPSDYTIYALITALTAFSNSLINFIYVCPRFRFKNIELKPHFKPTFTLFSLSIVGVINGNIDKAILGALLGPVYVSYYSVSFRLTRILQQLFTAMSDILSPNVSKNLDSRKNQLEIIHLNMDFIFLLFPPALLGIILYSKDILLIMFGKELLPAQTVLGLLSFTIPVIALTNVVRRQILLPHKKDRVMIGMNVLTMGINIILNLILIPVYKHIGAAVTTLIAETAALIFAIIYARKMYQINLFQWNHLKYVLLTLLILPVYWIKISYFKDQYSILILSLCIALSVVTYTALLFITKDKYALFFMKKK